MLMDRRGRECLHPPSYLRGLLKYTPRKASQQMQLCLGRPCHRLNWRIGFQWRRSVWEGVNMPDCLTVPSLITFSPHSMPAPSQVISSGFTPLRKDVLSARALFMRHHPKSAPAPSPPPLPSLHLPHPRTTCTCYQCDTNRRWSIIGLLIANYFLCFVRRRSWPCVAGA